MTGRVIRIGSDGRATLDVAAVERGTASSPPSAPRAPRSRGPWSDLAAALDNVGERDWFARGAIEGEPIVLWVAPEKSGKSWTLIDLAVATVTGGKWLGRYPVERAGSVVYFDAEYGAPEFVRRVARIARGRGHDPREVVRGIRHCYSTAVRLHVDDAQFRAVTNALRDDLPALCIVDPLRNHLTGSENDAQEALGAMHAANALRDAAECPVVLAHHLNKAGGMSGSRALLGRADLLIEGTDEEQPWYAVRGRTLRASDPIAQRFTVQIRHERDDDDREAMTMVAARAEGEHGSRPALGAGARKMLAALKSAREPLSVWRLRKATGQNAPTAQSSLEALEAAGLARRRGDHWEHDTGAFFDGLTEQSEDAKGDQGEDSR